MAHAPEAVTRTQPEPFIVSTPFLRPVPPNWQVACWIYPRWEGFCLIPRADNYVPVNYACLMG